MMSRFFSNLIYNPGMSKLPLPTLAMTCIAEVTNGMSRTSVYTYLPKLVKSFGIPEKDVGSVAGYISSAMIASSFLFSFLIGYLTDRFNKKHVLICTCLFGSAASLGFGFTTSIRYAVIARVVQGIPGILITAQAMLFEKCDQTNKSVAVAFCLSSFNLGMVLGPVIGGYFSFPDTLLNGIFSGTLLTRFPILLPNMIIALWFLCLAIGITWLRYDPETTSTSDDFQRMEEESKRNIIVENENEDNDGEKDDLHSSTNSLENLVTINNSENKSGKSNNATSVFFRLKETKICRVIANKNVILCVVSYMLYGITVTGFNDIYPLWASTSRSYNGLGFSTKEIASSLMIASLPLVFILVPFLSKIIHMLGLRKTFVGSLVLQIVIFTCFPFSGEIQNRYLLWTALIGTVFSVRVVFSASFTAFIATITGSVNKSLLGTVNGVAFSALNVTSGIAPYVLGTIFSWSLRNVKGNPSNTHPMGFPLDQYLVFMLMGFNTLLVLLIVSFIKVDSNHANTTETNDNVVENDFLASLSNSYRARLGSCTGAAELL